MALLLDAHPPWLWLNGRLQERNINLICVNLSLAITHAPLSVHSILFIYLTNMSAISEPRTRYVGRRRLPDPSTTATIRYDTDSLAESNNGSTATLNTLSLLIESKWSMFHLRACPGRVAHIPWQSVGAGKTFTASTMALGDGSVVVLKRPRLLIEDSTLASTHEVDVYRSCLARSIMQEIRVLTHLPLRVHENIITLFGIGWESDAFDESLLWPVMTVEFAQHGNLAELVSTKPVALPVKLGLLRDVARSLTALHACGITHGDVKSANVLVCRTDDRSTGYIAKLSDFGFSVIDDDRGNDEDESKVALRGATWPWNPPEWRQLVPRTALVKSDIYSYGLLAMQVWEDGGDPFLQLPGVEDVHVSARFEQIEMLKSTDALLAALTTRVRLLFKEDEPMTTLATEVLKNSVQAKSYLRDLSLILNLLDSALM